MRRAPCVFALTLLGAILISTPGCMTLHSELGPYSGVRMWPRSSGSHGRWGYVDEGTALVGNVLLFFDLPLSLSLDTALLPFSIPYAVHRKMALRREMPADWEATETSSAGS